MLVGQGALDFALENGFSKTNLLTEKQKEKWQDWKTEQAKESAGEAESNELDQSNESNKSQQPLINEDLHDTIAMLGIDAEGNLYGGCSTSGWGYKIPGRVGDSPIIGSGLYVDNKVGAAGATGLGENVMRHCGSFLVVEMMRWGASPTAACELAIKRIAENDPKNLDNLDINFIAINKDGETGAAGTSKGFKYSVTDAKKSKVLKAKSLSEKPIGPEGGNTK
jgi:N4-(beta-N-acetylglucosaminyl)-L-asparaginase